MTTVALFVNACVGRDITRHNVMHHVDLLDWEALLWMTMAALINVTAQKQVLIMSYQ